jgi:hypothetical protein
MDHDTRDLDGVIDEVAQAMTGAELRRDLRPAIAARIASAPPWSIGWRAGMAATVVAAVVIVAVVVRTGSNPPDSRPVAGGGGVRTSTVPRVRPQVETQAVESLTAVARPRPARMVARQTIDAAPATEGVVEIPPLAIEPLDTEPLEAYPLAPSQVVQIVPIDVEPVRIGELDPIAE